MSRPTLPLDPTSPGEFGLIARHFQRPRSAYPAQVALGIGDDCALLTPSAGHQLAISSDMLVLGRHFFPDVDPASLGHKALAVNLSDLAAMGARPLGFTLALALPDADEAWLSAFTSGLFALADARDCPLIGGDTTRGPLNICITVFGEVAPGQAMRRDAAQAGDDLWLSGRTGEARLALALRNQEAWAQGPLKAVQERMDRPWPRMALGRALSALPGVHAALDVSDGLAGDLRHILSASGVGAEIQIGRLPVAPALQALDSSSRLQCLLAGGDDYELLFTAAPQARESIEAAAQQTGTPCTRIGRITAAAGLLLRDAQGASMHVDLQGFNHFAS
jgi:thiamine-monophosphate kinase